MSTPQSTSTHSTPSAPIAISPTALLTKTQVAEMLQVHVRTIDNCIADGRIAVIKIGRSVRIEPLAVEEFINANRVEAV